LAKQGASEYSTEVFDSNLALSSYEIHSKLMKCIHSKIIEKHYQQFPCPRKLEILIHKLRLNAWNTKYSKNVTCCCSIPLSVHHLLFDCPILLDMYKRRGLDIHKKYATSQEVLYDSQQFIVSVAEVIYSSPVKPLL